jgi:hypothetical protein
VSGPLSCVFMAAPPGVLPPWFCSIRHCTTCTALVAKGGAADHKAGGGGVGGLFACMLMARSTSTALHALLWWQKGSSLQGVEVMVCVGQLAACLWFGAPAVLPPPLHLYGTALHVQAWWEKGWGQNHQIRWWWCGWVIRLRVCGLAHQRCTTHTGLVAEGQQCSGVVVAVWVGGLVDCPWLLLQLYCLHVFVLYVTALHEQAYR